MVSNIVVRNAKSGYVVYEGRDMRQCITKLERLQENLLGRLNKIKKGDKHGK